MDDMFDYNDSDHPLKESLYKTFNDISLNCIIPEVAYEICERKNRNVIGLAIIEDENWIRIYYSKHYITYRASSDGEKIDKSDRIKIKEYIINLFKNDR